MTALLRNSAPVIKAVVLLKLVYCSYDLSMAQDVIQDDMQYEHFGGDFLAPFWT